MKTIELELPIDEPIVELQCSRCDYKTDMTYKVGDAIVCEQCYLYICEEVEASLMFLKLDGYTLKDVEDLATHIVDNYLLIK